MATLYEIPLLISESLGLPRRAWPVTRGVPLPKGALQGLDSIYMTDPEGRPIPAQFRVLSRWPDGSLKWVLADFQADLPAGGQATCALRCGGDPAKTSPASPIQISEDDDRIAVCTGPLRFEVSRRRFSFLQAVQLGHTDASGVFTAEQDVVGRDAGGQAYVRICESFFDADGNRHIYGMGGDCLASLAQDVYSVRVEEAGPLRAVLRCDGAFEADIPAHHYAGYRPFHFTTRIYAFAGQTSLRVLHTVVVACNPRETEIREIALRVPASLSGPIRFRVSSRLPEEGQLRPEESLLLSQRLDNHFRLDRRVAEQTRTVAEGERAEGWMTAEDARAGVGVALRHTAEEYPKALGTSGAGDGIDVYLYRDPDGAQLSLKRYAEAVSWHEGEGVYADGTGVARTSEFFVCFYPASEGAGVPDRLRALLAPPHVAVDPAWAARCEATGGFASFDPARFPESEQMMTGFVDWMDQNIRRGRWYGFFDWGDVLVAWEAATNDWRFRGRWGWCNSEWDPRHGVWIQYLRTGDPALFALGEAMTRHSTDVDTCHYHPFRPYMVGGCFRHSTDHFGDEPCASHTFLDNWMDYYCLTGDLRVRDVLLEAGAFFLRYRWTGDPTFSFSLRSIANVLRGLLYVHEVTGDPRFKTRAEEVYQAIARGQNDDGSWHKRFQVSTPDRLPNQAPYGMATEGTTLAVEMGTVPPFTDAELRGSGGYVAHATRVLPLSEQKGYQTHYLMIGLELLHRLTGRKDVAEVYRRAVDWFCGHPGPLNAQTAIQQRYGGVICRHLAYAYRLTGDRKYLEIGRAVLRHLISEQDRSDDPRRRGAVGLSPMYLSLLFFGVPCLLGALKDAGMEERE